ncbi:MAG: ADP-ribose pyrophosphatase [Bacteroidota bacterium]|nr:ADP-ribose pyrophosphatase [Bacteroidota bacterium]
MSQMYKLFINNKTVFLCQNPAIVENLMHEDFIIEPYVNKEKFRSTLNIILNNINKSNVVLFYPDIEKLFAEVTSHFECIEAAGGVVKNQSNETLLIHRLGCWDLPKGKIEKKETIEQAAIREVLEETGLTGVKILKPITFKKLLNKATYHSYYIGEKLALKVSYWFEMFTTSENLIPQKDEHIEQAIWVKAHDIPSYFDNMYPSIIDVLKEVN